MSEVGLKLHISKPAVTYLTDLLENKKCLARQPDPKDRRISRLKLLAKGEKKVHEAQSRILRYLLQTLDQFSPDEQKTVMNFYKHLGRNIEEILRTGVSSEK
jgi:MarR family transcriptional regulator, organic hydroperoxide resistance regulator